MTELNLSILTDQGPKHFATASGYDIQIGRDVEEPGVQMAALAVSSLHGNFSYREGFWLYRDLGSTNGSWINGSKLEPEQIAVLRNGDILKLADVNLQIVQNAQDIKRSEEPAVLVFKANRLLGVANVLPQLTLRFGGLDADFPVPDSGAANAALLEFDGNDFIFHPKSNAIDILFNSGIVSKETILVDRDRVLISDYCLIISDAYAEFRPKVLKKISPIVEAPVALRKITALPEGVLAAADKKISNPMFGNFIESSTAIEDSGFHSLSMDPMNKNAALDPNAALLGVKDLAPASPFEDKTVVIFGGSLAFAFIALLSWWLFF